MLLLRVIFKFEEIPCLPTSSDRMKHTVTLNKNADASVGSNIVGNLWDNVGTGAELEEIYSKVGV